jgi:hypothetical protein
MERLRARFSYAAELRFRRPEVASSIEPGAAPVVRDPELVFAEFVARFGDGTAPNDDERAVFRDALRRARGVLEVS